MTIQEKLTAIAAGIPQVYGAGSQAGKAELTSYITRPESIFYKTDFPENYHFSGCFPNCLGSLIEMFRLATGIRSIDLQVPTDKEYKLGYMLYSCASVETVILPEGLRVSSLSYFAGRCTSLRQIRGQLDLTASIDNGNSFTNCPALEEVRFTPGSIRLSISFQQSDRLSAATVASILEGLGDLTDQTAQTLTLHPTVRGTLTQEQKDTIRDKNWFLA